MADASEITSSMQDYLEAMLILSESADEIRVTDIASKLNVAKASVAQAINHLKKHGLVRQERYSSVELTEAGKRMRLKFAGGTATKAIFKRDIGSRSGHCRRTPA
jgi:Mn-dependent DtxR family transcriptional regulator